ncbi:class I SAM-dependent methyltransferase [Pseudodesulfovibrio piezophilus]|uniref:Methyltransferase type 11 n=1 Tax=Pseudodesulfovibrio piezophilus (strain DSM 21447 / JCM 15486 / C1TLV30) TaxID=1322246 RepID=M1WSN3_PSEP2|nr:class I SAM-dependent methyltransferase [Pseudodesulfovibrio piezophilus]CCH48992.1 Methyltransferase type 11 [Pseudodesulfovibrio piezophilus C1TLV30]
MDEYARFASLYDPVVGPFLRPVHSAMQSLLVENGCTSVVDLCCGTGQFCGMVWEVGLSATGVDNSPAMLAVATKKWSGASFSRNDATRTDLTAKAFDAVTISFALHEKSAMQAEAILKEAERLVRPGGTVLVSDYRLPSPFQARLTRMGIGLVEWLAGAAHYAHFRHFMAQGGIESFLKQYGLPVSPVALFMGGWAGLYIHRSAEAWNGRRSR